MKIMNNTERVVFIGSATLVPGVITEVVDAEYKAVEANPSVIGMIASGELAIIDEKKRATTKPDAPAPDAPAPRG